jgi:hypothetical protein
MWTFLIFSFFSVYILSILALITVFMGMGIILTWTHGLGIGAAYGVGILGIIIFPLIRLLPLFFTKRKMDFKTGLGLYLICLSFDALLVIEGFHTMRASAESASHGGGLLGDFGLIYIAVALIVNLVSLFGILGAGFWRRKREIV